MRYLIFIVLLFMAAAPARAVNLEFNGTISAICSLAIGVNGTLGLSDDGTVLGSDEARGPARHGSGALDRQQHDQRVRAAPSGHNMASEQVEVAYSGLNLLSGVSQDYTQAATSFSVGTIALSVLRIDNRIVNLGASPPAPTPRER